MTCGIILLKKGTSSLVSGKTIENGIKICGICLCKFMLSEQKMVLVIPVALMHTT
jgi:hypothetical protein